MTGTRVRPGTVPVRSSGFVTFAEGLRCFGCQWRFDWPDGLHSRSLRAAALRHVASTGHVVELFRRQACSFAGGGPS